MTDEELREIKARAEAFKRAIAKPRENFSSWKDGVFRFCVECPDDTDAVTAAFLFYHEASEDIPALIAKVERLRKSVDEAMATVRHITAMYEDANVEIKRLKKEAL